MTTQKQCPLSAMPCRAWMPAVLVLIVGVAISMAVFRAAYSWERHSVRQAFDSLAEDRFHAIDGMFQEGVKLLSFMDNVFLVGPPADSPEFTGYVRSLKTLLETDFAKKLDLHGMVWVPRVARDQQAAYQKTAQAVFDPGYQFRKPNVSADKGSEGPRTDCYPSYLCIGKTLLRDRLGEDLSLDPKMEKVMRQACDAGKSFAVAPGKLSADADARIGYRVFQPLYAGGDPGNVESRRRTDIGFLCLDLDVGEMVDNALKNIAPVGIEVTVNDDTDSRVVTVCRHLSRLQSLMAGDNKESLSDELELTSPTEFFGRKLLLRCRSSEAFWANRTIWQPWVLLGCGLALTLMAAGHQISRALHTSTVERTVMTRLAAFQQEIAQRQQAEGR